MQTAHSFASRAISNRTMCCVMRKAQRFLILEFSAISGLFSIFLPSSLFPEDFRVFRSFSIFHVHFSSLFLISFQFFNFQIITNIAAAKHGNPIEKSQTKQITIFDWIWLWLVNLGRNYLESKLTVTLSISNIKWNRFCGHRFACGVNNLWWTCTSLWMINSSIWLWMTQPKNISSWIGNSQTWKRRKPGYRASAFFM